MKTNDSPAVRDGQATPRLARRFLSVHAVVSAFAALPLLLTRHPPLYDYYQWMFQGHVVARLLPWGLRADAIDTSSWTLALLPIPNLAAPVGIALLNGWFSAALAARLFALVCVLGFAWGFARFVRTVQGRPTAAEFLGYLWCHGYLLYKGYLSNQFALALVFLTVSSLHRSTLRPGRLRGGLLALLAVMGVLIYLSHLLAWAVLLAAIAVYGSSRARSGRVRDALLLAYTQLPAIGLLVWYARAPASNHRFSFYDGLGDKLISVVNPLMLFLRSDPLPEALPVFFTNFVLLAALLVAVPWNLDRSDRSRGRGPALLLGALLVVVALAAPLAGFGGAGRPEERWVLPGLMIWIGSLNWAAHRGVRTLAVAALAVLTLAAHAFEFHAAGMRLDDLQRRTASALSVDRSTIAVTLAGSRLTGGCEPSPGPSFGVPALKWFDLHRLLEAGMVRTPVAETSLLRRNPQDKTWLKYRILATDLEKLEQQHRLRALIKVHEFVVVNACADDLTRFRAMIGPTFEVVDRGSWFAIFRRNPARGSR